MGASPGYRPLEITGYLDRLQRDGELLAEAAARAGLAAAVPTCPGWQVRDLLAHVGYVHRWATSYLAQRHTRWVDRLPEAGILRGKQPDQTLLRWYRDGHAALVETLAQAPPDLVCWTFLAAPSPLLFWARRQAHETAIHRADAELAVAGVSGSVATPDYPPEFAIDGIDELIMGFLGREASRGTWDCPPGEFGFHAEAGGGPVSHWRVVSQAGHGTVTREPGPAADCDVTGPAAGLYLLLWNRLPAEGLKVAGDHRLLARFRGEFRVTWA